MQLTTKFYLFVLGGVLLQGLTYAIPLSVRDSSESFLFHFIFPLISKSLLVTRAQRALDPSFDARRLLLPEK